MIKLYKYASSANEKKEKMLKSGTAVSEEEEDEPKESHVGAAMSDLTNRRVIILVLMMLIIIPVLTVSDADVTYSLAVQIINSLALLNKSDPATYKVTHTFRYSLLMFTMLYLDWFGPGCEDYNSQASCTVH